MATRSMFWIMITMITWVRIRSGSLLRVMAAIMAGIGIGVRGIGGIGGIGEGVILEVADSRSLQRILGTQAVVV